MSETPKSVVVAAFDFDGTITHRDTLFSFLLYAVGPLRLGWYAITLIPVLGGYALRLIPNSPAKERVFRRILRGRSEQWLQRMATRFAADVLPSKVRPEALQRLAWHKGQGHRCVVISASLEDYLRPWAEVAGFDGVIATRLQRDNDGRLSGCYDGENCYGPEKVRRLREWLGPNSENVELYAYGDSGGDRELLEFANHAYYKRMPGERDGD